MNLHYLSTNESLISFTVRYQLKQMIFLLFNKSKIGFDVQIMATQKFAFILVGNQTLATR